LKWTAELFQEHFKDKGNQCIFLVHSCCMIAATANTATAITATTRRRRIAVPLLGLEASANLGGPCPFPVFLEQRLLHFHLFSRSTKPTTIHKVFLKFKFTISSEFKDVVRAGAAGVASFLGKTI
jgi:hypothetical protein